MTMKHQTKTVSAESENVITDVTFNSTTGILTFTQKNFYTGNTTTFTRDLSGIKLSIVKLNNQAELTTLEGDNTREEYKKTHLFLVPLSNSSTNNIYAEYIYVETSTNVWEFESIGSTEVDLTNYVLSSSLGDVAFSNDYTDLDNTPQSLSDLNNDLDVSSFTDNSDTKFTPKNHTHGNLENDGRFYDSAQGLLGVGGQTPASNQNVVTDSNGYITTESKNHTHTSSNITDLTTVNVVVTYSDNTTETLTLFKQTNNS